ncbi:hypothetical protein QUF74_13175 [Candidatus Halobeggiatoa sp. HSG11]|nr:hypothetical protein [Candidatus Halobeggiatoa sp. HSG11]
MINKKEALQLIDISANMTASIAQARAANGNILKEDELRSLFVTCVDMVHEKFEELPTEEQEADEKFATIGEMNRVFSDKLASLENKADNFDQEKFTSISEMHRVFAEKIGTIERRLATIPVPRTSRRPV